jgi:nitroreductase
MLYHSLEKGMALPWPRPGFGEEKAWMLLESLELLVNCGAVDSRVYAGSCVLGKWLEWNAERNEYFPELAARFSNLSKGGLLVSDDWREGGVTEVKRAELMKRIATTADEFMLSRHSIREFSERCVDEELIDRAVQLAQCSPSLCNRQSAHVYVMMPGDKMVRALNLQGGNKGFSEQISKLLIVTSELGCFLSVGERNQCWVEGGLFAMALLYGLHAQGLGACCLNWAKEPSDDKSLHELIGIPEDQQVVMMIAVGHLPETFRITHSPRRKSEEILHTIKQ